MSAPTILVIDDDAWQCDVYKHALQPHGIVVQTAQTLNQAIEYVQDVPNAIIADMLLAGETIFTLLHELQSDAELAAIPVIAATNVANQFELSQLKPYGVVRLIDKAELHPDDIVAAVRSVVI